MIPGTTPGTSPTQDPLAGPAGDALRAFSRLVPGHLSPNKSAFPPHRSSTRRRGRVSVPARHGLAAAPACSRPPSRTERPEVTGKAGCWAGSGQVGAGQREGSALCVVSIVTAVAEGACGRCPRGRGGRAVDAGAAHGMRAGAAPTRPPQVHGRPAAAPAQPLPAPPPPPNPTECSPLEKLGPSFCDSAVKTSAPSPYRARVTH